MSYATKYRMGFFSDLGRDYEILIATDGYSGPVLVRGIGSPKLRMPDGDTIRATSLTFAMECLTEAELTELYTTEPRQWKVTVLKDNVTVWTGWIVPELYSEQYIDPPYDVIITASDGLGYLKNSSPVVSETKYTIMQLIRECLLGTGLQLPFVFTNSADYTGHAAGSLPWFFEQRISLATFDGKTRYEMLEALLTSMNATLTQRGACWTIERNSDLSVRMRAPWQLSLPTVIQSTAMSLGTMAADLYPDGSLSKVIVPALRSHRTKAPVAKRESFFANPHCNGDYGWTVSPAALVTKPREVYNTTTRTYEKANYYQLAEGTTGNPDAIATISQSIGVEASQGCTFRMALSYMLCKASPNAVVPGSTELEMVLTNRSGGQVKYLSDMGWSDSESYLTLTLSNPQVMTRNSKGDYSNIEVNFTGIPGTGTLELTFRYRRFHSLGDGTNIYVRIGGVTLVNTSYPDGVYQDTVMLQNASTEMDDTELSFDNALMTANVNLVSYSHLVNIYDVPLMATWQWNGKTFATYLDMMSEDYGQMNAVPRIRLSGKVMGDALTCDVVHDTHSNRDYQIRRMEAHLKEDLFSVDLLEILPNTAQISVGNRYSMDDE